MSNRRAFRVGRLSHPTRCGEHQKGRVNDKFTYTYDFGDYWLHQVRVKKMLPSTALSAPRCAGVAAGPAHRKEVGGPSGYDQRTLDQLSWHYEALDQLLAGEDIREDDVPTWLWTYQPEHFDTARGNERLAKRSQLTGHPDFLYSQGGYDYFFAELKSYSSTAVENAPVAPASKHNYSGTWLTKCVSPLETKKSASLLAGALLADG